MKAKPTLFLLAFLCFVIGMPFAGIVFALLAVFVK